MAAVRPRGSRATTWQPRGTHVVATSRPRDGISPAGLAPAEAPASAKPPASARPFAWVPYPRPPLPGRSVPLHPTGLTGRYVPLRPTGLPGRAAGGHVALQCGGRQRRRRPLAARVQGGAATRWPRGGHAVVTRWSHDVGHACRYAPWHISGIQACPPSCLHDPTGAQGDPT